LNPRQNALLEPKLAGIRLRNTCEPVHVAKEVRHEQFYDLDVLTVTVDTRPLV